MRRIFFIISFVVAFLLVDVVEADKPLNWKSNITKRKEEIMGVKRFPVDTAKLAPKPPAEDTVQNREVTFDLEKLSRLATSLAASKMPIDSIDGHVLLVVALDSNADFQQAIVKQSSNKKYPLIAIEAVKKYLIKYKVQPARKDGVNVKQENILLPIIFDRSMFD